MSRADDQLAGKGRKSSSSAAAAAAASPKPAPTGAIKSPTGIKSFADLRKPTGGMFAGSSRKVPETAASRSKSSPAPNVKGADGKAKDPRGVGKAVAQSGNDSSDEEPLATKAAKLRKGSQPDKVQPSSSSLPTKPAFRIDAHGKKRARFVGDESDEDESTRPIKKKKKKTSAALPELVISDSE